MKRSRLASAAGSAISPYDDGGTEVRGITRSSIALAFVTLILGGILGFVAGAAGQRYEPVEPAPGARTSSVPSADPSPSAASPPAEPIRAEKARRRNDRSPDVTTGAAMLTGSVAAPDGAPLAGVLVRATARIFDESPDEVSRRGSLGAPPPLTDIQEQLREFEARLRREEAALRETTTGADGTYRFTGLAGDEFRVDAWLIGWRIERDGGEESTPAGGRCDFKATPISALTVDVLLPDGKPAEHALVEWSSEGKESGWPVRWTRGDREIELKPGDYVLSATAGPQLESDDTSVIRVSELRARLRGEPQARAPLYRSEPQTVTVPAAGGSAVTIRLVAQPAILVKFAPGSIALRVDVRVAAVRLEGAADRSPLQLLGTGARVQDMWVRGTSEATLTGVDPGAYLVGVTFRGGIVGPSETVTVADGLATVTLQLPGEVRDHVRIRVRAPDGSLVRDAEIECGCQGSEGGGAYQVRAEPQEDGSYITPHFEFDAPSMGGGSHSSGNRLGIGKRTYYVTAKSAKYAPADAAYDPAADDEVTVQFVEPARLSVSVTGYAANPNRKRIVLWAESKFENLAGDKITEDGRISAAGSVTFPPLRPGEYDVVLALTRDDEQQEWGSRWSATRVSATTTTLAAGEYSLAMTAPTVTDLVVTFDAALAPKSLQLQRVTDDRVIERIADESVEDGQTEAVFRDLKVVPGRYRLVSRVVGDMWIELPGATRIAFRPRAFNSLQVRMIAGSNGYLTQAGLLDGDVVVAVNGTECENTTQIDALLAAAKLQDTVTLSIRRNGRRTDVTVDPKRLDEGGRLAPWVR